MARSNYEAPADIHSSAAKPADELGPWPGTWRRIELDAFVFDYKDKNAHYPGYVATLKVNLFGHDYCKCHRSDNAETVRLFLPHPIGSQFPVHCTVSGAWLAYATEHGFGCPLPGFITEKPWTCDISYGYLNHLQQTEDEQQGKGMVARIGPSTAVSAYCTASEHAMDLVTMWRRGQRFLARYQVDDNKNADLSARRIYTIHFSAGPGKVQVSDDAGEVCILFIRGLHHFEWLP